MTSKVTKTEIKDSLSLNTAEIIQTNASAATTIIPHVSIYT